MIDTVSPIFNALALAPANAVRRDALFDAVAAANPLVAAGSSAVEISALGQIASNVDSLQAAAQKLQQASPGALTAAVHEFIGTFNRLRLGLDSITPINLQGPDGNAFGGNSRISEALIQAALAQGTIAAVTDSPMPSDIGIRFLADGTLGVDSQVLQAAFADDPAGVIAALNEVAAQVSNFSSASLDPALSGQTVDDLSGLVARAGRSVTDFEAVSTILDPRLQNPLPRSTAANEAISAFLFVARL
ncbi:MAG: hypothetical protein ACREUA_10010 [Burkholderiales bacterium]